MKNSYIIVVDNDKKEFEELIDFLIENNFSVKKINKIETLTKELDIKAPDLLILPVEMKNINGIDLCSEIKSKRIRENVFVILISKKKEEYSLIAALDSGADDFLFHPIHLRVLLSRINALLKRKILESRIKSEGLVIDKERYIVIKKGKEFYLPKKEFEILTLLESKPEKVFSRDEIKRSLWTNFEQLRGRTVDVHIRKIREKIGDELISTVKGVGYKLHLD